MVEAAKEAEQQGAIIDNDMMSQMYPETFEPGRPEYLERDFEAGADFICDEVSRKYGRDVCADPDINWR